MDKPLTGLFEFEVSKEDLLKLEEKYHRRITTKEGSDEDTVIVYITWKEARDFVVDESNKTFPQS